MTQRKKLPDESKTKEGEEKHRRDDQSRVEKKQSKLAVVNNC
jgi:hypothetical protein